MQEGCSAKPVGEELSFCSLLNHLKLQKQDGKKWLDKKGQWTNFANELAIYNEKTHMVGVTITENMQVFHVKVFSTFLHAGVPLYKLELFRQLFEENGHHLTDTCKNVYFIQKLEFDIISEEICKGKDLLFLMSLPIWMKY